MRTVARFQFFCGDSAAEAYTSAVESVQHWADKKFKPDGSGGFQINNSKRSANFKSIFENNLDCKRISFLSTETVGESVIDLKTQIMHFNDGVLFQSSIRVGAVDASFIEPSVSIRAPRFVQDVLKSKFLWKSRRGSDRVFARIFDIGTKEYRSFESLLTSSHRHLPLVLVSEGSEGLEIPDIDKKILWSCCGLAHVCRITTDASWLLTQALGKEWSCYNGAIRIYQPDLTKRNNPFLHRLWTQFSLRRIVESSEKPADIVISKVCDPIFEASCYLPLPEEFEKFDKAIVDQRFSELISEVEKTGDDRALAQLYCDQVDLLQEEIEELRQDNRSLRENIRTLLKYKEDTNSDGDNIIIIKDAPPQTAREAIEMAKERYKDLLVFSDNLEQQIESIRFDAGPPESILHHLEVLSNLSSELNKRSGSIGVTQVNWLKDRGIKCSGESETKKGSGLNIFPVRGISEDYELHLKVNDATSPDKCVRIYFKSSVDFTFIKVGYVGSKKLLM